MTDTAADFLTRIRNALTASHETVTVPSSRLSRELARILSEQGYIEGFDAEPPEPRRAGDWLRINLRYTPERRSVITGLRRVSRPGRRVYVDARHIPKIQGG